VLTIPEEMLLLNGAWWPKRPGYALLDQPLAAARLIELVLARRVSVDSGRRQLLARDDVVVTQPTPTGDALLDEVLERLAAADVRSCTYWIKRMAKGSEAAHWDRLVATSLLRLDTLSGDAARHVADADAVAAVRDRIRAVLAQPEAADVRDVALVTLLAHTQSLFALLHDPAELSPSGLVRGYRAHRRDDRLARQALDMYMRLAGSVAGPGPDQPRWAMAAANAIGRIAMAAGALRGSGPG
jgi:hypothetical protein